MRTLIFLLTLLLIAVAATFYLRYLFILHGDPGYVIIGYGHWSLETSLFIVILAIVIGFVILYVALRLFSRLLRLPRQLRTKGDAGKIRRSQEAVAAGLMQAAEGHWEKAEKTVLRHAQDSGAPLINYLTAARLAQSRGASEKRDKYLRLAQKNAPQAAMAIKLTQAEWQLSHRQFEAALLNLAELKKLAPTHAQVLKLLHQVYARLEDWEALQKLLPALHENKILLETEIIQLEAETYSALLKQKVQAGDRDALKEFWQGIPEPVKRIPDLQMLYFTAMIEKGAGGDIEEMLCNTLIKEWDKSMLALYSRLESTEPARQLERAENWLHKHPHDAELLWVLGKLSMRQGRPEKAEDYLRRSLALEDSVEAHRLMGDLLAQRGDKESACDHYRNGLLLASNEAVAQSQPDRIDRVAARN